MSTLALHELTPAAIDRLAVFDVDDLAVDSRPQLVAGAIYRRRLTTDQLRRLITRAQREVAARP